MKTLLPAALLLTGAVLPRPALAQAPVRHATVLDLTAAIDPMLNYGSVAAGRLWGLDAAGFTLGPDRPAQLLDPASPTSTPLRPVAGNLLQGSRPDRGSLNSELYAAVGLTPSLELRAGYSHLITAYQDDASRYQRFVNLAALGLSY